MNKKILITRLKKFIAILNPLFIVNRTLCYFGNTLDGMIVNEGRTANHVVREFYFFKIIPSLGCTRKDLRKWYIIKRANA